MSDFEQAIEYVLQNEGGSVDNPKDKGGNTNFGITTAIWAQYCASLKVEYVSKTIDEITVEDAKAVYKAFFWDPISLSQVNQLQATCILDVAVNSGQGSAVKFAQLACGFIAPDGVMGPKTIASINGSEPDKWLHDFLVQMKDHYVGICLQNPSQLVFLRGWLDRALRMILLLEPV